MKNGICPKCQSREVYWHKGSEEHEQITVKEAAIPVFGAFAQTTWPDKYLCTSCGYIEYYLTDAKAMQVVKENWEKVAP
jgi:predicted nucleic-acid-binding Zn-ribbon protein